MVHFAYFVPRLWKLSTHAYAGVDEFYMYKIMNESYVYTHTHTHTHTHTEQKKLHCWIFSLCVDLKKKLKKKTHLSQIFLISYQAGKRGGLRMRDKRVSFTSASAKISEGLWEKLFSKLFNNYFFFRCVVLSYGQRLWLCDHFQRLAGLWNLKNL